MKHFRVRVRFYLRVKFYTLITSVDLVIMIQALKKHPPLSAVLAVDRIPRIHGSPVHLPLSLVLKILPDFDHRPRAVIVLLVLSSPPHVYCTQHLYYLDKI